MSSLNGVLPVDKPEGPTSHDVVDVARRALGMRRIGHTGTLDPFASGLLLLCLGPATRLAEYLIALPKSYRATMRLGMATDTDDRLGEPLRTDEGWSGLGPEQIEAALATQQGVVIQRPPRYSAKRVAGERMYALARRGDEVDPAPVEVNVHRIEMVRFDPPEVDFEVDCESGTYIRAIARDVGETLGVGAHLTALRRTRIGQWTVATALPLASLSAAEAVSAALRPPARALSHLPRLQLDEEGERIIRHGGSVPAPGAELAAMPAIAILSAVGDLLAIGECRGDRVLPRKVFA